MGVSERVTDWMINWINNWLIEFLSEGQKGLAIYSRLLMKLRAMVSERNFHYKVSVSLKYSEKHEHFIFIKMLKRENRWKKEKKPGIRLLQCIWSHQKKKKEKRNFFKVVIWACIEVFLINYLIYKPGL